MRTSVKSILSLLLLLPLGLTACVNDVSTNEESLSDSEINQSSEVPSDSGDFISLFGGNEDYKIVRSTFDSATSEIFQNFMTKLREKTKISNIYPTNLGSENDKEVLIGYMPGASETVEAFDKTDYFSYCIEFIGNKLVVSYYTPDSMEIALNDLLNAIYQAEDGSWGVSKEFKIQVDTKKTNIPKVRNISGRLVGGYISNNSQCQIAFDDSSESDFINYSNTLMNEGFTQYSSNQIGDNKFATYVNSTTEVHLIWFAPVSQFRIVFSDIGYLPSANVSEYTKLNECTVTQIGRYGASNSAAGESYIIQLEDGSYVIIDGGPLNDMDADGLLSYLVKNKPTAHEKPKVIWMFTHLHVDHTDLAVKFLRERYRDIELTMLCYNFPNTKTALKDSLCANTFSLINSVGRNYPGMETFVFHSGQKLLLPGCEIEFLYSQEDYWPQKFETANDTSATWRMNFSNGHSFLVLGDSEKGMCTQMSAIYGDYLESDILQLSHHGLNGATLNLYQLIDPKICFWAIDEERFLNDKKCLGTHSSSYDFNLWLRSSDWTRQNGDQGSRSHYSAGRTVTVRMSDLQVIKNELIVLD